MDVGEHYSHLNQCSVGALFNPKINLMNKHFKIDFFELIFLAQICIPPVPIARGMFWIDLCDVHYHEMNDNERKRMFDSMVKQDSFSLANDNCSYFYARFNESNQYVLTVTALDAKHTTTQMEAFKFQDKYYVSKNKWVNESCIVDVKPKQPKNE